MTAILIRGSNRTLFKYLCQDLQDSCLVQEKTLRKLSKKGKNFIGFPLPLLYQDVLNNKTRNFEKYLS